ncbi:MAG: hypothetical protein RLN76_03125 [Phycisphaeraceae bacterium]
MNWNLCWYSMGQPQHAGEGRIRPDLVRRGSQVGMFVEENLWEHPYFADFPLNDGRIIANTWPIKDTLGTFHRTGLWASEYERYKPSSVTGFLSRARDTGDSNVLFIEGHVDARNTLHTQSTLYDDLSQVDFRYGG